MPTNMHTNLFCIIVINKLITNNIEIIIQIIYKKYNGRLTFQI